MGIDKINVEAELERFYKYVIQQARTNLTKEGINASGSLYRSLDFDITENQNSLDTSMSIENYGEFIDKGVKGVESGRSLAGYKYTNKKPPLSAILKYMAVKPIRARNLKTGRFIKQRQGAFAIQNHIYKKGIKPTEFFSKPFRKAFETLPEEIIEAYGLDVEQFMEFVFKD